MFNIAIKIPVIYPEPPITSLGYSIKKTRLEHGLIQKDLAKILGVDEMTIVNWEKDRTIPHKNYRNRIKKYLSIRI